MIWRWTFSGAVCAAMAVVAPAQPSVLQTGNWFQFSVKSDGIYKIDYNLLRQAGLNPDQIDPRNLQLFTGSHGMLPQPNSSPRLADLQELAIEVIGEGDGRFDRNDFILFYANGPDRFEYRTSKSLFFYENNLYDDKNFYYLSVRSQAGKRLTQQPSEPGTHPIIREFEDFGFYETERYNELKSGRQWFGEQFDARLDATIQFDVPGIVGGSSLKFVSHVMGQSFANANFKVFFNNVQVADQPVLPIPNTQYGVKGSLRADTITFSSALVGASGQTNQLIRYEFVKAASLRSVGYLNYFIFTCKRALALYGKQTRFSSEASLTNAITTFEVSSLSAESRVWDISDRLNPKSQSFLLQSGKGVFSTATTSLKSFMVFNSGAVDLATFEKKINNQNLREGPPVTLIIITAPDLQSEAQRLAAHRNQQGISSWVVTTNQIYHEFSGGKQDVVAIRDFIRHQYLRSGQLKNVLLLGRGSYDYKNRIANNTNLVPLYMSRNSLSPLETYSSDDFFGFLESNEGEWRESPAQNHTLDVGIGRIPAKTMDEATIVVTKLIEYDTHPKRLGPWHKQILFVADDGDFNIHHTQSNDLARNNFELPRPEFDITRIWVDNFEQPERPSGQISPATYEALDQRIEKGALIVNFTGHGSEQIWMQERALDENMIVNWRNRPYYPLFVTATCEFGRHDDPQQISSGEKTLLKKNGGTIGLVTTARPVNASTNFTLNQAFYKALFNQPGGLYRDLGAIFRETKNNSQSGVANRNFSLLGDPSMFLALPRQSISITSLQTGSGSDTLKGKSRVLLSGEIHIGNQPDPSFNGEITVTLFDALANRQTRGDENAPFAYNEYDQLLFKGKVSVLNGAFEAEFILPVTVPVTLSNNKLSLFASATDGREAAAATIDVPVGGTEPGAPADTKAPDLELFVGDTTFLPGNLVGPNTILIARLHDKSGINLSSRDTRYNLIATLDGEKSFILNDYYQADLNSFESGSISFPLKNLTAGRHIISLSAADTYLNVAIAQIEFTVSENESIVIGEFGNYPNPFTDETAFLFDHTRQGEDLEAQLRIYNLMGQPVAEQQFSVTQSAYRVLLTTWDGQTPDGTKIPNGVYIARLVVRCLSDGSKNEAVTKLFVLK
ncbi:MAG: type IX secretion system sortase PorU [Cyclobacteriaceae bacterium]